MDIKDFLFKCLLLGATITKQGAKFKIDGMHKMWVVIGSDDDIDQWKCVRVGSFSRRINPKNLITLDKGYSEMNQFYKSIKNTK